MALESEPRKLRLKSRMMSFDWKGLGVVETLPAITGQM